MKKGADYTFLHGYHWLPFTPAHWFPFTPALTDAFVRVHRSYIVGLSHATSLLREDGRMVIVMDAPGNPRIPVGRNHMEQVRRRLGI